MNDVTYRWVERDEAVALLSADIEAQGWAPLNDLSRAIIAESSGKVVGYMVLQLHPLLGPSRVLDASQYKDVFNRLVAEMKNFLAQTDARGVLTIAENPAVARLCRMEGMTRIEYPVYIQTGLGRVQ